LGDFNLVHFKDRYNFESFSGSCGWVSKPSVWRLGVAIAPNPDSDRHPEIKIGEVWYDEKGWKHTILGRLQIVGKHVKVFCPKCHKRCRSGSYSKTPTRNHYEPSWRGPKRGRWPGPDRYKEQVDEWVERIKQTKNTTYEVTLEDVEPQHLQSRVKRILDKQNEGKENSNVT
jgi:hypothetical protein